MTLPHKEYMFEVTKDWINANRTEKKSFTRKQIQALGLKWPPEKGWINKICGSLVPMEDAEAFEINKDVYSGYKMTCPIDKAVKFICQRALKLTPEQKARLANAIQI